MGDDLYEDLTEDEKALRKRDMEDRIEQQRSKQRMFIVTGILAIIMAILVVPFSPILSLVVVMGAFTTLFAIAMWLRDKGQP